MSRAVTGGLIKKFVLVAGLAGFSVFANAGRAENLADTLAAAYINSGLLEQNRALLRAADEDVAIAQAALRPVLAWSASFSRNLNDNRRGILTTSTNNTNAFVGLTADWLLYSGGSNKLNVDAAKETVLATRQDLISIEQQVLLQAVAAYMGVIASAENVNLRLNNLSVLNRELQAAQDRFDVGEVTRTDVALAQARVAQAESSLALARGDLLTSQARYAAVVGREPGSLDNNPPLPAAAPSLEQAIGVAVRNHPDILAGQHLVAAATINVQRATADLAPQVSAGASIGRTENWSNPNFNEDIQLSLSLRQSIYSGGALSAAIRRAMASRDSFKGNLITVQRQVVQDATSAFTNRDVTLASLQATDQRIAASQIAFDGIREEATLGARTTLDVLIAEQDLLDARTARVLVLADRYIAAYELLAAQGLLTAERLGLNVPIYDPTVYYNLAKGAPAKFSKRGRDLDRVLEALGKQ